MQLSNVVTRLRTALVGQVKSVGGSADFDAAADGAVATPAAFVMPISESAEENAYVSGLVSQRVQVEFAVLLVVSNRRDATGEAAMADLATLRQAVRASLLGWVPDPDSGSLMQYSSGRLLRLDDGRLWWADQYRVHTFIRSN